MQAVYTNNKPETRKNGKSKKGRYVIVQFKDVKNPVYSTEAWKAGKHAGYVLQYEKSENRSYKRYNYAKTIDFRQNKNIYGKSGKLLKKAGRIVLKNNMVVFDDVKYPKKISGSLGNATSMPYSFFYSVKGKEGKVEAVSYNAKDYYANDGKSYKKIAYVYLPNGYKQSSSKKYPILYYMHGTNGNAESQMNYLKGYMDNMINEGLIEPMILVCPTYYTNFINTKN